MRKFFASLILLFILGGTVAGLAQNTQRDATTVMKPVDSRRLLVQPRNPDGSIRLPSFWSDPVLWLRDEQQNFYGAMSKSLRGMGGEGSWGAGWGLMTLSLAYGVFHAAGPGHGKAVISGWLLATENQLRRGILVALLSALVQALSAIILVSGALLLVTGAATAAKAMTGWLESASFAMIAAMGLYLVWTGLRTTGLLYAMPGLATATAGGNRHFEIINPLPAGLNHDHGHDDDHVHGPDCGHAHAPTPTEVSGDWSWARAATLSLAVGIRPCTGAILVLLFANSVGIYWAGVASTFVMALGTFATVSVAASIAVYSKQLAERLASRDDRWLGVLNTTLRLGGGVAIFLFGMLLFAASWGSGMADGGF